MAYDKEKRRQHYLDNKERLLEQQRVYRKNNKEAVKKNRDKYLEENKEHVAKVRKAYKLKNKEEIREKQRIYDKERRTKPEVKEREKINAKKYREKNKDKLYHLTWNLRVRIHDAFRRNGYKKTSKTCELLGTTFEEVKTHIEQQFTEGMSWDLVGPKIHIDHKIPLASAKNEEELIKLFHYTNLQPLWAEDNMKKGSKILTY